MQDFNYNIIDNIINRKMKRLDQITQSIEIKVITKSHSIKELMELSEEVEGLSLSLMPYFKNANIGVE
ncbi:MAG: hypothetical protein DRG78_05885 [Epsilonproteobacteria bacterium]|nr:MAG: hypothetical protein DRG78_05885 [Campylobacterota bacterium]